MTIIKKLNGEDLTIEDVVRVAVSKDVDVIEIDPKVLAKCRKSQERINEKGSQGKVIYGVTTGFGSNADKVIRPDDTATVTVDGKQKTVNKLEQLQINLLRSHCTGLGDEFPEEIVRAIMLIRLNTLLKGYSGVQEKTLYALMNFINKRVHPVIPQQGSVGSSGDLCPLSHMALPLIGEGWVRYDDQESRTQVHDTKMRTQDFFARYAPALGIEPLVLGYKEGLALNNGTTVMVAVGAFAVTEAEEILNVGLTASSLFFEALCAREDFFAYAPIHAIRRHSGQADIAKAIRKIAAGSTYINLFGEAFSKLDKKHGIDAAIDEIIVTRNLNRKNKSLKDFLKKKSKPQDSYSVRCTPQVFGASLHAMRHIREVVQEELNAAVDNPLIFVKDDRIISGGNFHGQPIALVMDYLKIAVAEIGNITERQINKLVDDATNDCLPSFLTKDGGLNYGLMISQYAAASIVSENKVLTHPASTDSIPTCANTEDHVSMGTIAARQALEIVRNVKKIVTIALLTFHHGFLLRKEQLESFGLKDLDQSRATKNLYEKIKGILPGWNDEDGLKMDRFLHDDLVAINETWPKIVKLVGSNFDVFVKRANPGRRQSATDRA
jgi:histidine ammonia-lyase